MNYYLLSRFIKLNADTIGGMSINSVQVLKLRPTIQNKENELDQSNEILYLSITTHPFPFVRKNLSPVLFQEISLT